VIAQLFNAVGPRQSGQHGMVIPRVVERALSGRPIETHGDGSQTRSFCHVREDVRPRELAIDKIAPAIGWRPTYSLDASLRDVVERVRTAPVLVDNPGQIVAT
jgi:nucleoside-diphosphate-sugar epimerase